MQELSLNKYKNWPRHEIFSGRCIPPDTRFFIRLDGWKFGRLSEARAWRVEETWNLPLSPQERGKANPTNFGMDKAEEEKVVAKAG